MKVKVVLSTLIAVLALSVFVDGAAQAKGGNLFGAIAVAIQEKGFGFSFNYPTRDEAEERAMTECEIRAEGNSCRNIVWVRNGCAAVALRRRSDDRASRIVWAVAKTKQKALDRAKEKLGDGRGKKSTIFTCTDR